MRLAIPAARETLRRAMQVRKAAGIPMDHAICVFDLAQQLDVEVWFKPLASLAGLYSKPPDPLIIIGSDRPAGYQASTCGHELGHHVFGHGTRVDEYVAGAGRLRGDDPDEAIANLFSAHLLMPQAAVNRAFASRHWEYDSIGPEQVFTAACHLGVGYQALVHHLRWTLEAIEDPGFDRLLRIAPGVIRASILGREIAQDVVVVDSAWLDRPVDLVVGDVAILPSGCSVEGRAVEILARETSRMIVRACRRGLARADRSRDDWSAFLRVMPRGFDGAAIHRHLEDPDEP